MCRILPIFEMRNILPKVFMTYDPSSLFQTIAQNIIQGRRARGWSQQDLATQSQVSRRMIGMVESGENNVSLATLGHLAAALGLTFSELVADHQQAGTAPLGTPSKGLQLWQGSLPGTRVDLLQSFPATRSVELWRWTIAPGDQYHGEPDLPGYREMLYVVSGELTLEQNGTTQRISAGNSIVFPTDQPYKFMNLRNTRLEFILNVIG